MPPGLISVTVVVGFYVGWEDAAEVAMDPLLVEPFGPPARGDLEDVQTAPVSAGRDDPNWDRLTGAPHQDRGEPRP